MTSIFQEREEAAIQAVAARYKSLGYDVVVRPGPVLLPEPLKQFRPDLLAKNAKEKVVVEVRSKATLSEAIPAKRVAQTIESMPGWRFELVVVNPELQTSVPARGEALSLKQITARTEEARTLASKGHLSAAFLVSWSAAEAVLRRIAAKYGLDTSGYSPAALYKELYSIGAISRRAYETFAEAVQARNSLVHGFKVSAASLRTRLGSLIATVERLLPELNGRRATIPRESGRKGRRTTAG
jgi:hypothetical protein